MGLSRAEAWSRDPLHLVRRDRTVENFFFHETFGYDKGQSSTWRALRLVIEQAPSKSAWTVSALPGPVMEMPPAGGSGIPVPRFLQDRTREGVRWKTRGET